MTRRSGELGFEDWKESDIRELEEEEMETWNGEGGKEGNGEKGRGMEREEWRIHWRWRKRNWSERRRIWRPGQRPLLLGAVII